MSERYEMADDSVRDMIVKVINAFPDKFMHVKPDDLHLVFRDVATSTRKASTRLLSGLAQTMTKKKVAIDFWKKDWINAKEYERAAVVYHELKHILYDTKQSKYKLRHHDVESFTEVLREFGIENEKAEEIFTGKI